MTAFVLTAVLLLGFAPFISTYAAESNYYQWDSSSENVSYVDLSSYFGAYEGSFVLYDLENGTWSIHDIDRATLRVAPNSTYKIYDALFSLEDGVITPEKTFIAWDGKNYPFDTWNTDQTLVFSITERTTRSSFRKQIHSTNQIWKRKYEWRFLFLLDGIFLEDFPNRTG